MNSVIPRLLFAAPASGGGKTTVTCAFLRALKNRGVSAASFKCGPDYIDPMFHRESVGTAYSSNLDLFFSQEGQVRYLLTRGAERADLAVIEGAMGYYDGTAGTDAASAYAVARATGTPVVLIADCRGMALSVAAQIKGFMKFRRDSAIAAVVLNRISPARFPQMKAEIERECGLPVAGYLPPMPDCTIDSRHLGLVSAAEVEGLAKKLDTLAAQFEDTGGIETLLQIAASAPPLSCERPALPEIGGRPTVAVARDAAFCFYYPDTLALLEELGARLVAFSPLVDSALPEGADALLLGGGYPELHAAALAENEPMRRAIREAIGRGMPTIAECGGFLYLHRSLEGADGERYPMAGLIDAEGFRTDRLGRFGYVTLTAHTENLLCHAGETLPAHEFHYWDSTDPGAAFTAQKPLSERNWPCAHVGERFYAGFAHLYLPARPDTAARFLRAAITYRKEREG